MARHQTTNLILVEDEPEAREALSELLEVEGFHVVACADSREALAAMVTLPRAVLVIDLVLPGMDGIALAHEALRRRLGCGIVIVSGHPPTGRAYPSTWQWVQKPFAVEALIAAIAHARCD